MHPTKGIQRNARIEKPRDSEAGHEVPTPECTQTEVPSGNNSASGEPPSLCMEVRLEIVYNCA